MQALVTALAMALGMAMTHSFALASAGYFKYPLLDVLMHAAGGGIIGVLASRMFRTRPVAAAIIAALAISIAWEVFEFRIGMTLVTAGYCADTLSDLVAGVAAAALAVRITSPHVSDEKR